MGIRREPVRRDLTPAQIIPTDKASSGPAFCVSFSLRRGIEGIVARAQILAVNERDTDPQDTEFRLHSRIPEPPP